LSRWFKDLNAKDAKKSKVSKVFLKECSGMSQTKYQVFRELHQAGCFLMPNPWDIGSARLLAGLGFKALATTSAGFAWSMGKGDHGVSLQETLEHLRAIAAAVEAPVNADFEGGYAVQPEAVGANVAAAAATGVAGLSIEDSTGDADKPLFDFPLAVERIRAARQAIDASGRKVLLTGRSEGFIAGRPDLAETIRRLEAYAEAGADCLYAPGVRNLEDIRRVVEAVRPKPVNVLASSGFATLSELRELGVRRISVGGGLARAAWTGFLGAAREIAERGTFTKLGEAVSSAELNEWIRVD
jgi:2-methylisocitrate lyase-like PEP mutase family enzyme